MNSKYRKKIVSVVAGIFISSLFLIAQIEEVYFLRSTPSDGIKILEAYVAPWADAIGAGLNGSWYNTAKPHKPGGFDLTIGVNVGIVPESARTFDVSSLGLSSSLSGTGSSPTIAGTDTEGPLMTYSQSGVTLASWHLPPGTDWKYIPVPTAQVGIGLPLGTEIKIRLIPRIPVREAYITLIGAGLMHSIMQYIPGNELIPVDVSVFGGYTRVNIDVPFNLLPDPEFASNYSSSINPVTYFDDQKLAAKFEAMNAGIIASVNLPVITFYGGLGYSKTRTLAGLEGHYPTPVAVTTGPDAPYAEYNDSGIKSGDDFEKIDVQNFSGLRANAGFRIKLSVFTVHADYTRALYNVLSAGVGISFR
jgi:hypothetical protein